MKILLIRHGDPDYEHDTLTEQGWVEAELLARRLQSAAIDDFYLSPLGRAQDTAGVTLKALGRTGETLPWLREFWGGFDEPYTGMRRCPWNLMPQYWTAQEKLLHPTQWREDGLLRTGDVAEVYDETVVGVDELLARYGLIRQGNLYTGETNPKTIALFCHVGSSMAILSHLMMISPAVLWQAFFMPTASVTTLVTEERTKGKIIFRCCGLGDASHLEGQGRVMGRSGLMRECFEDDTIER